MGAKLIWVLKFIHGLNLHETEKFLVGLNRGLIATYHTANWCKILISSDQGFTMFEGDKFNQEMREDLVDEFGFVARRMSVAAGIFFVHFFTYFLLSTRSLANFDSTAKKNQNWHTSAAQCNSKRVLVQIWSGNQSATGQQRSWDERRAIYSSSEYFCTHFGPIHAVPALGMH